MSLMPMQVQAEVISSLPETLEQQIDRIALSHDIDPTHLYSLASCESKLDPEADNGYDRGIVQINRKYHPEISDEQAFDPEFALNWAAEKIAKGEGYMWTCGNCFSYVVSQLGKLPRMKDILPNTSIPRVGDIIIFDYSGEKHIAVQHEVTEAGIWIRECNFKAFTCGKRLIEWGDRAVVGYMTLEA